MIKKIIKRMYLIVFKLLDKNSVNVYVIKYNKTTKFSSRFFKLSFIRKLYYFKNYNFTLIANFLYCVTSYVKQKKKKKKSHPFMTSTLDISKHRKGKLKRTIYVTEGRSIIFISCKFSYLV